MKTTVVTIGQVEIDEIYVGINKKGTQYVLPVQAKGGTNQLSVIQTRQDIRCCAEKFPGLVCRPVSVQFLFDKVVCMFELVEEEGEIRVLEEKHYHLLPADEI
jgi:hypothetical protein